MAIKKKDGEDLSKSRIEEVISLLEAEKPITKKVACDMLRINYNTARLTKIIDEYKEEKERVTSMKKVMRSKPIQDFEITKIVEQYLSGDSLSAISDRVYRSTAIVKRILHKYNIPLRSAANTYHNPPLISESAIADDYAKGDLTFSARYNSLATIDGPGKKDPVHGMVYPIWVSGDYARSAYQPWYELADLRKLQKKFGIKAIDMPSDEVKMAVNEAVLRANRGKKGKDRDE